jgi:hypothetical protein
MRSLAIYCADVGSIQEGNFAWARGERRAAIRITHTGEDIAGLAERIVLDFDAGQRVALGFECPLFLPVRDEPDRLTCQRNGEHGRPWSVHAGAQVLVMGLAQTIWLLRTVRRPRIRPFLEWEAFTRAGKGLFLWEAFVLSRGRSHEKVAVSAVKLFARRVASIGAATELRTDMRENMVQSLIGAALLRTRWSHDLSLLEIPCVVIKE